MRKKSDIIQADPLEQLFASARDERLPSDEFRQRVMSQFLVPPSRNMYRIPMLAMAAASVMLIAWVGVSGLDVYNVTERVEQRFLAFSERVGNYKYERNSGIRLIPEAWTLRRSADDAEIDNLK